MGSQACVPLAATVEPTAPVMAPTQSSAAVSPASSAAHSALLGRKLSDEQTLWPNGERRDSITHSFSRRSSEGVVKLYPGKIMQPPEGGFKGRIAIVAQGSRGDFQPYLALALKLRDVGYHVRMYSFCTTTQGSHSACTLHSIRASSHCDVHTECGAGNHIFQAQQYEMEFFAINFDLEELLSNDAGMREAMTTGDVKKFLDATFDAVSAEIYANIFTPVVDDLRTFQPTLMLSGMLTRLFSIGVAELLAIPQMWIDLQPTVPSRFYPSIIFDQLGIGNSGGSCGNTVRAVLASSFASECWEHIHLSEERSDGCSPACSYSPDASAL
jgi:hypothetical protein